MFKKYKKNKNKKSKYFKALISSNLHLRGYWYFRPFVIIKEFCLSQFNRFYKKRPRKRRKFRVRHLRHRRKKYDRRPFSKYRRKMPKYYKIKKRFLKQMRRKHLRRNE